MFDIVGVTAEFLTGGNNVRLFLRRYLREQGPMRLARFLKMTLLGNLVIGQLRRRRTARRLGIDLRLQITFSPLSTCNLSCRGCYASDHDFDQQMDADTVCRVIAEGRPLGVSSFAIMGGEPFLWKHLFAVLERNPSVFFTIATNGTLICDETAQRLRRTGNAFPFLGVDGFRENNDAWRGAGVFDQVMEAMARLRASGVPFGYQTCARAENIDEVTSAAFVDFMMARGAYYAAYSHWGPSGANPGLDHMPTSQQCRQMFERLAGLEATRPMLFHKEGHDDGSPLNRGCGAGRVLNILPDGSVEPCVAIHFSAGNVHRMGLVEILQHPFYAGMRALADEEPCHRCVGRFRTKDVFECVRHSDAEPTNSAALCQIENLVESAEPPSIPDKHGLHTATGERAS